MGGATATIAQAAAISGTLNIAGSITVTNVNGGTIHFDPLSGTTGPTFDVIPSTGSFLVLNNDTGTETSTLDPVNEPVGTILGTPITGFLTLPGPPALTYDLTEVLASTNPTPCTPATSSGSCSIAGAPYDFNTGSGGASATFSVLGNLNYMGQTIDNVVLQYSATFTGETIGQVITAFETSGSSVQSSDAELTVTVTPEPSTLVMLFAGMGLCAVSLVLRKHGALRQ